MSVTYSHHAYYGNDGKLLSGWASLAKGFALVRSHQDFKQQLPVLLQGLPRNFINDKLLDSELKKNKHLYLFSIIMLRNQPLPLFEGDTMRSATDDFGGSGGMIYIQVEDEEDDDKEKKRKKRSKGHDQEKYYGMQSSNQYVPHPLKQLDFA